jgi:hypothetical protein
MSAESESEKKNFVDPNPKKKFPDPQHWYWYPALLEKKLVSGKIIKF